uniref:Uncharacterized protein n=1 Tax=Ditylenchus dipsaci TaxID=166011 RepID=A0A915E2B3_9BILA
MFLSEEMQDFVKELNPDFKFLESALKVLSPFVDVLRKNSRRNDCHNISLLSVCHGSSVSDLRIQDLDAIGISSTYRAIASASQGKFSYMTSADRANFDPTFLVACAIDPNTASQMLPVQRICSGFAGPMDSSSIYSQQGLTLDMTIKKISNDEWRQRSEGKTNRKSWILGALYNVQSVGGGDAFVEPIKYWHGLLSTEWNKPAALAIEILSIPATSAPIERIF